MPDREPPGRLHREGEREGGRDGGIEGEIEDPRSCLEVPLLLLRERQREGTSTGSFRPAATQDASRGSLSVSAPAKANTGPLGPQASQH